jgi:hypothetical protein
MVLNHPSSAVSMLSLNLPAFEYHLQKVDDGQLMIWDILRKQHVVLTPEEWVRQHFVNYLLQHVGIPRSLLRLEAQLRYGSLTKWADMLAYDRQGNPLLMAECKASTIAIDQDTLLQLSVYDSAVHAPYLILTNGLTHYHLYQDQSGVKWLTELPTFGEM